MLKLSIVVPVYNGEHTLKPLFEALLQFETSQPNISVEYIFVFDCGHDDSWNVLMDVYNQHKEKVSIVSFSKNFGQHNAILCGFEIADGDYTMTMDEDLQHHPMDIKYLLETQQSGDYDVVYAEYKYNYRSKFRNITSTIYQYLRSMAFPSLQSNITGFRLLKKNVIDALLDIKFPDSYHYIDAGIAGITSQIANTPLEHRQRVGGRSGYNIKGLMRMAFDILFLYTNVFAKLFFIAAFLFFIVAMILVAYPVLPYIPIIVAFSVFSIVATAFVLLHQHHIMKQSMNFPSFVIRYIYRKG